MKLKLNGEYAKRHLFVVVLMVGLGAWFGYDGFVRYPALDAAALFERIEGRAPGESTNLAAFKQQKIQTQYGFTFLSFLVAAIVGVRLWKSSRLDFSFDETGFTHNGQRFGLGDITRVDRSRWEKKGIIVINGITLDAWHHTGVKEFVAQLDASGGPHSVASETDETEKGA